MVAGQGLQNYALCVGGTWICLVFYTLAKGIMYAGHVIDWSNDLGKSLRV
jgi:hypothetical protein